MELENQLKFLSIRKAGVGFEDKKCFETTSLGGMLEMLTKKQQQEGSSRNQYEGKKKKNQNCNIKKEIGGHVI